jgi:MFS transporter, NNP family, nitrate/nitrite transporter
LTKATSVTDTNGKATRIELFRFDTPPMRAFHMSWVAFFLCFFAWFGIAPLMAVVRKELQLTPAQVGNVLIASVAGTIFARLLVGWLCDRYGPRRTYAGLLVLGAIPVVCVGFARDYQSFLLLRLAIGAVGASFVITQYHTSAMFAPNVIGTANATTAGWGNMGGGAAQLLMPLLFSAIVALGATEALGWRLAMVVPGVLMFFTGIAYWFLTQDSPDGGRASTGKRAPKGSFLAACRDYRVWLLALVYGACFGIEITIHNVAALYFTDRFSLGLKAAGLIVGAFGMLALFARALGGWVSDKVSLRRGLGGRVAFLGAALLAEGVLLILFSRAGSLPWAAASLICFGLFVHVCCGATYAVIPFVNRDAVGAVAGIVGAGGNVGAVLSGFLFRGSVAWPTALLLVGVLVTAFSCLALLVRFEPARAMQERPDDAPDDLGDVPATAVAA